MNGIDTAILIVILLSFLFGLWRGLVQETLSLLIWIAALLMAWIYSDVLAAVMVSIIDHDSARYVAAFALIFVAVMMLGTLLNHLLAKLLNITGLKLVDRLLGGVFGIARGVIIILVVLFTTSVFVSETQQWRQSKLIPYGLAMIERSRVFVEDTNTVDAGQ